MCCVGGASQLARRYDAWNERCDARRSRCFLLTSLLLASLLDLCCPLPYNLQPTSPLLPSPRCLHPTAITTLVLMLVLRRQDGNAFARRLDEIAEAQLKSRLLQKARPSPQISPPRTRTSHVYANYKM